MSVHETPVSLADRPSCVVDHVGAAAMRSPEANTSPSPATATHSAVTVHETPPSGSEFARRVSTHDRGAVGSVELSRSPAPSTATQRDRDGHERAVIGCPASSGSGNDHAYGSRGAL